MSTLSIILGYDLFEVSIMKPLKDHISVSLDTDVIEKVRILAEECDRSVSQYINLVLKKHINNIEKKQNQ